MRVALLFAAALVVAIAPAVSGETNTSDACVTANHPANWTLTDPTTWAWTHVDTCKAAVDGALQKVVGGPDY